MEFAFSSEMLELKRAVGRFVDEVVLPVAVQIDAEDRIPESVFAAARELGLFGMSIPPEYGGLGLSASERAVVHEQLGRGPFGVASFFSVHTGIGCVGLVKFGTKEQKRRYLPKLADGSWIGAFALTEPEAGSDAGALRTRAERRGDRWILNGRKHFITNGPVADLITVFARTEQGISTFLVERGFPGFRVGQVYDTTGHRGSQISELIFEDCEVPAENLLGAEGEGFKNALRILSVGRTHVGARCVGAAQRALELALAYAETRRTFGKPLVEHQQIRFWLAEMSTAIEAARLLVYRSAWRLDQGLDAVRASSQAKLAAAEVLDRVVDRAVQIFGGIAYVRGETEIERIWRDARVTRIYDGSSEVQKMVVARQLTQGKLEHPEGL